MADLYTDYDQQKIFHGYVISDNENTRLREALKRIVGFRPAEILSRDADETTEYLVGVYSYDVPVLDLANAVQQEPRDANIESVVPENRNLVERHAGTLFELRIPYTGDRECFRYAPVDVKTVPVGFDVSDDLLTLYGGKRHDRPFDLAGHFDSTVEYIEKCLASLRRSADSFTERLRLEVRAAIEARRRQLRSDAELADTSRFKIRKRDDAALAQPPLIRKKLTILPPMAKIADDPRLHENIYQDIIGALERMSLVMERSPHAFLDMEEEELRFHFLIPLNGQYEWDVGGETFNYEGKSDILISQQGKRVFVAECKFWNGEKVFAETIDQLLRYVTARDTKSAIVILTRRKNFTSIVEKAAVAFQAHPMFRGGYHEEGKSRFRGTFAHPDDDKREITVTLLLFDVPVL